MVDIAPRDVTLESGASAHLSVPLDMEKHPGLIVIQEVFGLVDHIRDIANRFCREGYVAIAPDYFDGETATTVEEGRKIREQVFTEEKFLVNTKSAVKYLKSLPAVIPNRIGCVGFCMGGGLSLLAACKISELAACVIFYGRIQETELVRSINCPTLGVFGEMDEAITSWAAKELEPTMRRHQKDFTIKVYPSAPHAFFNDTRKEVYRAEAAKDAWQMTLSFFSKHLRG